MERYRFGACVVDIDRASLQFAGVAVELEPRVFDLLVHLLRHRDHVVSKDDLIATVWRGRIVSESTISGSITVLRKAIGDDGRRQHHLRTIQRKGYRFVGAVHRDVVTEVDGVPAGGPMPEARRTDQSPVAISIGQQVRPTLTVLPFVNLSANEAAAQLAAGLAEDIATALSPCAWLQVLPGRTDQEPNGFARTSETERECGLDYLLTGSVRRAGNSVRVSARLIEARTGVQRWARAFDVPIEGRLRLYDRVTACVVTALRAHVERAEIERSRRLPPDRADAYELYLLGLSRAFQWSEAGIGEALRLFESSLAIEPEFAPASGMAAYCYLQRASYGWIADRQAETAACKRMVVQTAQVEPADPTSLARAALSLASVVGDVDGAHLLVDRALQIDPHCPHARYVRGWIRLMLGRIAEGGSDLHEALRLVEGDPLAFKVHAAVAYAQFLSQRYDAACLSAARAISYRPGYLTAMRGAAAAHALAGRHSEAQRLMVQMRKSDAKLRASGLHFVIPFQREAELGRWADGLRRAGLPD